MLEKYFVQEVNETTGLMVAEVVSTSGNSGKRSSAYSGMLHTSPLKLSVGSEGISEQEFGYLKHILADGNFPPQKLSSRKLLPYLLS
jgi:hypothetical protein